MLYGSNLLFNKNKDAHLEIVFVGVMNCFTCFNQLSTRFINMLVVIGNLYVLSKSKYCHIRGFLSGVVMVCLRSYMSYNILFGGWYLRQFIMMF